jgi:hypothetical protein
VRRGEATEAEPEERPAAGRTREWEGQSAQKAGLGPAEEFQGFLLEASLPSGEGCFELGYVAS